LKAEDSVSWFPEVPFPVSDSRKQENKNRNESVKRIDGLTLHLLKTCKWNVITKRITCKYENEKLVYYEAPMGK
jgi:hypothetical protein